jgi:hypothetical protein
MTYEFVKNAVVCADDRPIYKNAKERGMVRQRKRKNNAIDFVVMKPTGSKDWKTGGKPANFWENWSIEIQNFKIL